MALQTERVSYAFDPETVQRLERLAQEWSLSRSAVLRKLVRDASAAGEDERTAAWHRIRGSISRQQAEAWHRTLRIERAAADGRLPRGKK